MTEVCWDTLIQGALVIDGCGNKPEYLDIALKNGKLSGKEIKG